MNSFIYNICVFLSDVLNDFIIFALLFELGLLIVAVIKLVGNSLDYKKNVTRESIRKNEPPKKLGWKLIRKSVEKVSEFDWEAFSRWRGKAQKSVNLYDIFTNLIQIFPLTGILGTVAGLYISISEHQDIYIGIKFALSSTVVGVGCAVLFKLLDAFITPLLVAKIEDNIEMFETNYNVENDELMRKNYSYNVLNEQQDFNYEEHFECEGEEDAAR